MRRTAHDTHCRKTGCKYGDPACPVVAKRRPTATQELLAAIARHFTERASRSRAFVEWSADVAVALNLSTAEVERAGRYVRRIVVPGRRVRYSGKLFTVEPTTSRAFSLRLPREMRTAAC